LKTEFTSREVVQLTGISPRQLQWWDERGIVVPARQGRWRLYSLEDLSEVAVICELRDRGFSLQRVRKVVRFLQREFGKRLAETVSGSSDYHLLTDGNSLYLETCGHPQKRSPTDAGHLPERHGSPSARQHPRRQKTLSSGGTQRSPQEKCFVTYDHGEDA
jgi:DNA-binding transcriptional MerR regulator